MGENPEEARQLMLEQQQQFASAPTLPVVPMQSNKKQRELYVGNVPQGVATETMLKELFGQMLSSCEGYNEKLGPPVVNCQLAGGGTYAFIEFRDEELAETVLSIYNNNILRLHRVPRRGAGGEGIINI